MKKVLMIAYFFPPCGASGVYRTLRFMKYLPRHGWESIVLSVREHAYGDHLPRDVSLLQCIPDGQKVIRTANLEFFACLLKLRHGLRHRLSPNSSTTGHSLPTKPSSWQMFKDFISDTLTIPDPQVSWMLPALWAGIRTVRRFGVNAVYSTGRPWTAHLIGSWIRRLTGIPWVADFRDPWTQDPWRNGKSALRVKIENYLERHVVSEADLVVSTTSLLREDFVQRYPTLDPEKFVTITNGFDPEEKAGLPVAEEDNDSSVFTLTHVGTIYEARCPTHFLEALERLVVSESVQVGMLRINFVGVWYANLSNDVSKHPILRSAVRFIPQVSHLESLVYMAKADVLLLIQPNTKIQVPGKLFEYIQARKPVLALTDKDGATGRLITSQGLGWVVEADDVLGITKLLRHVYGLHLSKRLDDSFRSDKVDQYDARHLTGRLADLLNAITGHTTCQ